MIKRMIGIAAAISMTATAVAGAGPARNTDWAQLGNGADMQHHSELDAINGDTVGQLELAWWTEEPSQYGLVGNPLIEDGRIFQGGPNGLIIANDLRTGKVLWTYNAPYDLAGASFNGYATKHMNRGIALAAGNVIITANCRLFAVDEKTGKLVWQAETCDARELYSTTQAPRVGDGLVFIGNGCGDTGLVRGYVDAFDARTGARKWRFYTAPGDPAKPHDSPLYEKAAATWGTKWFEKSHGCASPWDAMTFDEKLHQLYIGTAAPGPSDPTSRAADAGDELYAAAIVAVDSRTGAYKWHFTQTPNDAWDFDSAMGIMVADLPIGGKLRRTVLSAPKNGFAYVLDAETGAFIHGSAYTKINWAKGLDAAGRPIRGDEPADYWKKPDHQAVVFPNGMGAHGWEAMAFDPVSRLLYIPSLRAPMLVKQATGQFTGVYFDFTFGHDSADPELKPYGEVVAYDPVANTVRWRARDTMPMNGGLLHTAGGLVFQGMADGRLVAFDDRTGKELWSRQTGGAIRSAPSSVMIDGEQYIIVSTGDGSGAASGPMMQRYDAAPEVRTPPRLLAFRLRGKHAYPPLAAAPEPVPMPPSPRQDAALAKVGEQMFEGYGCSMCHGADGGNSTTPAVPNLNRMPPADVAMLSMVVQQGALASAGMPKFDGMPDADVKALYAYIINKAWDAHDRSAKR